MSACRSCGAAVLWAATAAGKLIPLNYTPTEQGNVVLDGTTVVDGRMLSLALVEPKPPPLPDGRSRYMPHHATCPQADRWRRAKNAKNGGGDDGTDAEAMPANTTAEAGEMAAQTMQPGTVPEPTPTAKQGEGDEQSPAVAACDGPRPTSIRGRAPIIGSRRDHHPFNSQLAPDTREEVNRQQARPAPSLQKERGGPPPTPR